MSASDGEDEFVQHKPTLILFHGPPCIGKTSYYKRFYEKTYARFSLEEWLASSKEATLHSGIRRLAKKLKDGDSVVLDDCNPSSKARASLLSSLKKAGADFTLEGIEFRPQGGLLMSQIGAEVASASELEKTEYERLNVTIDLDSSDEDDDDLGGESDEEEEKGERKRGLERILTSEDDVQASRRRRDMIKEWSDLASGLKYDEGFKLVQYIDLPFNAAVSTEDSRPALFVDAQSIMSFKWKDDSEFDFSVELVSGIEANLTEWLEDEPKGHVIVLIDDETFLPAAVAGHADSPETQALLIRMCHEQALDALKGLKLVFPLYYYHVHFGAFDEKDFQRTVALGPVAWLQHRHSLSLSSSLWVAPCPKNALHAVPWDIPYISATEFFAVGSWDLASKLRQFRMQNTSLPSVLRQGTGASAVAPKEGSQAANQHVAWPLEAERRSLVQDDPLLASEWTMVSEEISFGRTHGCIFQPLVSAKKRAGAPLEESVLSPSKRTSNPSTSEIIEVHDSSSIPIEAEPSLSGSTNLDR